MTKKKNNNKEITSNEYLHYNKIIVYNVKKYKWISKYDTKDLNMYESGCTFIESIKNLLTIQDKNDKHVHLKLLLTNDNIINSIEFEIDKKINIDTGLKYWLIKPNITRGAIMSYTIVDGIIDLFDIGEFNENK